MLEALMRAAPAALSPEDLLERVWDEYADPFTKTVYVTVSRLRRKLADPEIITNIARVGYRISG
jgi:DNA-binding response OmpR family regulator